MIDNKACVDFADLAVLARREVYWALVRSAFWQKLELRNLLEVHGTTGSSPVYPWSV